MQDQPLNIYYCNHSEKHYRGGGRGEGGVMEALDDTQIHGDYTPTHSSRFCQSFGGGADFAKCLNNEKNIKWLK